MKRGSFGFHGCMGASQKKSGSLESQISQKLYTTWKSGPLFQFWKEWQKFSYHFLSFPVCSIPSREKQDINGDRGLLGTKRNRIFLWTGSGGGGGGGTQNCFIRGGSAPSLQPLALLYTIFSEKAPLNGLLLSYTFHWEKAPLSYTQDLWINRWNRKSSCHFFSHSA